MALSKQVKALVKSGNWQKAFETASNQKTAVDDDSYLIRIQDKEVNLRGYLKGDDKNYGVVSVDKIDQASVFTQNEARKISTLLRKKSKQIETTLVKRSEVMQDVGSQGTEKGEVIQEFLNTVFAGKDWSEAKSFIFNIMEENGLSENTNSFISFLKIYFSKYNKITEDSLSIINDLYANDEISTIQLQGKTSESDNHIIFNENLYELSYEDAEFVIQSYDWLSSVSNIKSYLKSSSALGKYNVTDINSLDNKKALEIRNKIIFKNSKKISSSEINSADSIKTELREFQGAGTEAGENEDASKLLIATKIKDTEKWKKLISKASLDSATAKDLIAFLVKEYSLK